MEADLPSDNAIFDDEGGMSVARFGPIVSGKENNSFTIGGRAAKVKGISETRKE